MVHHDHMNQDDNPVKAFFRGAVPSHMTSDELALFTAAQVNIYRLALNQDSKILQAILDGRPDEACLILDERNRDLIERLTELNAARIRGEYREAGQRWRATRPASDAT